MVGSYGASTRRSHKSLINHSDIEPHHVLHKCKLHTQLDGCATCLSADTGQRQRETGRVRRSEYNRVHEHDIPHRARTTAASKSLTKPVLGVLGPPKYREPSSGRIVQTCPRPHCGTALEYRRNRTGPHTGTEPAAGPLCPVDGLLTVCGVRRDRAPAGIYATAAASAGVSSHTHKHTGHSPRRFTAVALNAPNISATSAGWVDR
jgi:hypothetical protein